MRSQLQEQIDSEIRERMEFNDQNYRYLPNNLRTLIEAPPTRYEIYPKEELAQKDSGKQENLVEIMDAWNGRKLLTFSKDFELGNPDSVVVGGSIVNENYFQGQHPVQSDDAYVEVEFEVHNESNVQMKDL